MSFKNANQAIMRFVMQYGNTSRGYDTTRALIDARRFNSTITERDLGDNGKMREFKLNYYPIMCDAEGNCSDSICSTGTRMEPKQLSFNLTQCTASKVWELHADDIRFVDGNMTFSDHAIAMVNSTLPALRRAMAMDQAAILVAHAGLHLDGNATRRITMANQTNGSINPVGQWEIEREFSDGGFNPPFIIGSGEVYTWQRSMAAAGLNAAGLNLARLGAVNVYYDALIAQAVGDGGDHIIAFDPQVLKFLTFNRNAGLFATDLISLDSLDTLYARGNSSVQRGILRDPVTGLNWDLYVRFDPCCGPDNGGCWTFQVKLIWDIFFLPDIACNIQGVNGIFHYTTCPPVLVPCPTGDSVPPAATSKVYGYDPAFGYPMYITDITLGAANASINATVQNDAEFLSVLQGVPGVPALTIAAGVIKYTGYTALTGSMNNGTVPIAFAVIP